MKLYHWLGREARQAHCDQLEREQRAIDEARAAAAEMRRMTEAVDE